MSQIASPEVALNDNKWLAGSAPVAVIMISLNEGHNLDAILQNITGWAQEVFLVDSFSQDDSIEIALRHGVHVVQRPFRGFGDQWNFALNNMPVKSEWTMKLDPDERLSEALKRNLQSAMEAEAADGFSVERQLWLMGQKLPVKQRVLRVWRTGRCQFTDIAVNEYPVVDGETKFVDGCLEHHDSPNLEHWLDKQNKYTTAEAIVAFTKAPLAADPKLFGSALERRMWLKKNFIKLPFRYFLLFLYNWIWNGAWRAGWPGYAWARLRSDVMRMIEYKRWEMERTGKAFEKRPYGPGKRDNRLKQYD